MKLYPFPDLVWFFDMRKSFLVATFYMCLVVGLLFAFSSVNAAGSCYVDPCYVLVSSGKSFQVTMTGFLFILQPIYGLYFLKKRCSQTLGGAFIGATLVLALMALVTAVLWSAETQAAYEFIDSLNSLNGPLKIAVYQPSEKAFRSLSLLAAFQFVLYLISYGLLCSCREFFCEDDFAASFAKKKLTSKGNKAAAPPVGYQGYGVYHQNTSDNQQAATVDAPLL